jgi:hypothetical protein
MLTNAGLGVIGAIRNEGLKTTYYDFFAQNNFSSLRSRAIFHGFIQRIV